MKQLKEAGVIIPNQLAYQISNLAKWEVVEPMLLEEEAKIAKEFSEGL